MRIALKFHKQLAFYFTTYGQKLMRFIPWPPIIHILYLGNPRNTQIWNTHFNTDWSFKMRYSMNFYFKWYRNQIKGLLYRGAMGAIAPIDFLKDTSLSQNSFKLF